MQKKIQMSQIYEMILNSQYKKHKTIVLYFLICPTGKNQTIACRTVSINWYNVWKAM